MAVIVTGLAVVMAPLRIESAAMCIRWERQCPNDSYGESYGENIDSIHVLPRACIVSELTTQAGF